MIARFTRWLLGKVFYSKLRPKIEPDIKMFYRIMATENLLVKTEIVKVKKGRRRYELLFYETPSLGKIRVHLKRHWGVQFLERKIATQ